MVVLRPAERVSPIKSLKCLVKHDEKPASGTGLRQAGALIAWVMPPRNRGRAPQAGRAGP